MTKWEINDIDQQIINLALQEDLDVVFRDATTDLLLQNHPLPGRAEIISKCKSPIVLCGLPLVQGVLDAFQTPFELTAHFKEGAIVPPGATIATLQSDGGTLLMAERTFLNFLRHLSAVATLTHQFVKRIEHTFTKILDTRKTTPGWRHLEKYAVKCGGGVNHRLGLYDAIMVKDTHVDLLGGMQHVLDKLPEHKNMPVIVEVRTKEELALILDQGLKKINRVLLDNMSTDLMRECVKMCQNKIPTEASGGINLNNIQEIAETGVEFASVGMLTHSAGQVDLSMRMIRA